MQKKERSEKKRLALASWQALSDEWESGNLTQPEFCELKKIKLKTFLKWRQRVLREKETIERTPEKTAKQAPKHFLPAQVISQATQTQAAQYPVMASVIVKLPNGISLQIMPDTEKSFMKNLFDLLGIRIC